MTVAEMNGSAVAWSVATGRPRVLLNDALLVQARERARTTHRREYDSLVELAKTGGNDPGNDKDYSSTAWRLCFLALLSGEAVHIRAAVKAVKQVLTFPVSGQYFAGARRLKALACAYDWLHEFMGDELRYRVGITALQYCQALYDSGEIEPNNTFLGHNINQIPYVLMAGVAIGDEIPASDPQAPKACEHPRCERPDEAPGLRYVRDVIDRLGRILPCYRHFLDRDCFQQSYPYTCTYMSELPYLFQTADVALGTKLFEENAVFQNVVTWWTYAMRSDETFLRFGDYFCATPVLQNAAYFRPFATVASRYKHPLAQWWVNRFHLQGAEPDQILFEERANAVAPQHPETLPRTKYFDRMGVAVARGDFADGTVAAFKCTPMYLHNHGHRDANSFAIYHKGDLAIDSGAYDSYETPQWYNYYIRTIAHNTIVIHDPAERMISRGKQYANDGGQRFINEPHFQVRNYEDMFLPVFRDGQILAYREGNGFSYVCGDASNCYREEKLKRFVRHVVFVLDWPTEKAVSMAVLDEIEVAKAGLTPRYLLHTMERPAVEATRITALHGGGRLTVDVLTPELPKIEVIGGEGKEFWVDGANYALSRPMPAPNTPGAWRVEVSNPATTGTKRQFLTVLTADDVGQGAAARPTCVESEDGYEIRQGELTVQLARGSGMVAKSGRVVRVALAG